MTAPLRARNLDRSTELAARLEVADGLWGRFMGLMRRPGGIRLAARKSPAGRTDDGTGLAR